LSYRLIHAWTSYIIILIVIDKIYELRSNQQNNDRIKKAVHKNKWNFSCTNMIINQITKIKRRVNLLINEHWNEKGNYIWFILLVIFLIFFKTCLWLICYSLRNKSFLFDGSSCIFNLWIWIFPIVGIRLQFALYQILSYTYN
jgi:hypothetical protein